MSVLEVVEGAIAIAFLIVVVIFAWMARRTRRFRAGIFVERNGDEEEKGPTDKR